MSIFMPILIGLIAVSLLSLIPEPHRRRLNAVVVAGAGAAYLSGGGLGYWEFVLPVVMSYVAYRGLESWTFIGIGWLLHTAWDVLHHLKGSPILPFAEHSSFGCAICDPVIALWCFAGGPSIIDWARTRLARRALHVEHVVPGRGGARTDSRSYLTASCPRGTRSSAGQAGGGSCR
ncbi:DUF6010 family protein [Streptosporangium roseum]|uniref:Integral membrane protein n=1 Tax=Streptosporangium roseum (strain ATCC 12428 / DSM 43021 / JCM 3005 / KCTC 9067 / NCIMB 10171 / NRRL 2505 / NI 9100) TaxID=479432 RepID=D2BAA2_STRRD|nr:DUF6010 family protein [Streptosporangium roseum]ACZ87927.1 hypothetical protein Sros_5149 [Streptosporangium roseum DSM 43021]